jgi:uncharacterized membrane protein
MSLKHRKNYNPMSKAQLFISYFLTIATILIGITLVSLILSWIIKHTCNFIFSYFEIDINLEFIHVFIALMSLISIIIGISFLITPKKKTTIQSKAMKYEEDLSWFDDYVSK